MSSMVMDRQYRIREDFVWSLGVAVIYFLIAKFGLFFVIQPEGLAILWPVSGFMAAVLLLSPLRRWPFLIVSASVANVFANYLAGSSWPVSVGFAVANLFESWLVASLALYFIKEPVSMSRVRDVIGVTLIGGGIGVGCAAFLGALVPALGFGADYGTAWLVWWVADVMGVLIVTPFVLELSSFPEAFKRMSWQRILEAILLIILLIVITWAIFSHRHFPMGVHFDEYMVLPFLVWAAMRFGVRGGIFAIFVFVMTNVAVTIAGFGVVHPALKTQVIEMQLFWGISVFLSLLLAAIWAERKQQEEALRWTKERLALAQKAAGAGVWDWDMRVGRLEWSPEMFNLFGLDALVKSASFESWQTVVHPEDWQKALDNINRAMHEKKPLNSEYRIVLPQGDVRWIQALGNTIYNDKGLPQRMIGICLDVTARKKSEEALRISEERFKAIAMSTPDHILIQDKELRYTWVLNPQIGLTEEEMVGKTDRDIVSPEEAERLTAMKKDVMASGRTVRAFVPLSSSRGETEYFDGAYVPKYDGSGNVDGIIGYFMNVTTKIKAEADLKKSETRYRSLFENMLNGFAYCQMIFDGDRPVDFVYLMVNQSFEKLTGLKNVVGRKVSDVIPGIEAMDPEVFKIYGNVARTGVPAKREIYVKALQQWFSLSVYSPQKDHFVAVFDVITDQKKTEESMKKAKDDAEAIAKIKTDFLNSISHDFRTPMHAIMGFSAFLQSENLTTRQKKFVDLINRSSKSLFGLLEEILEVSRLESGRIELRQDAFDLNETIRTTLDLVSAELSGRNISLAQEIDHDIPRLRGDVARLRQILTNLTSNAVKYTDQGLITVGVKFDQEHSAYGQARIIFSVKDTGLGISPEKLSRIFDPFTRLHEFEGGREREGAGLGLYITKTLVELMSGEITVTSQVGVGSEFVVRIDFEKA